MANFWQIALTVSGLAAIGAFVFWSLYKGWLSLPVWVPMTKEQQYSLFKLFLILVFLFALVLVGGYIFMTTYESEIEAGQEISLEVPAPMVRATYHTVQGHAIALLSQGMLGSQLQRLVGGTPVVAENEVLGAFANLQRRFGWSLDEEHTQLLEADSAFAPPETLKVVPSVFGAAGSIELDRLASEPLFAQPFSGPDWRGDVVSDPNFGGTPSEIIAQLSEGRISAGNLLLRRNVPLARIGLFEGAATSFFEEVAGDGHPADFFSVAVGFEGCGDYWAADLTTPLLAMRLLVVKNVSVDPIQFEGGSGVIGRATGIGSVGERLDSVAVSLNLEGAVIEAGQALVIPVALFYTNQQDEVGESEDRDWESPIAIDADSLAEALAGIESLEVLPPEGWCADCPAIRVSPSIFTGSTRNTLAGDSTVDPYRYPLKVLRVDTLQYNGFKRPVLSDSGTAERPVFISAGNRFPFGSCPFVYSTDGRALGRTLTGRDRREKRGTYSKWIVPPAEGIVISEEEDETSFINAVSMTCRDGQGRWVQHLPEDSVIVREDERYHILRKGDQIEVQFSFDREYVECRMDVSGYYIPDTPGPATLPL